MNVPRWFVIIAGSVALIVWVADFAASLLVPGHNPSPVTGGIAMAVVSACFTAPAIQSAAHRWSDREDNADD